MNRSGDENCILATPCTAIEARGYRGDARFLRDTAKKKPQLQKLIDNVPVMDIEQIKNLNERKWIIKALLEVKQEEINNEAILRAEKIADSLITKTNYDILPGESIHNDFGDVYYMFADNYWLKYGKTEEFLIELKYGDLIFIRHNSNILSYEHIPAKTPKDFMSYVKLNKSDVEYIEYRRLISERNNNLYPDAPVLLTVDLTGGPKSGVQTVTTTTPGLSAAKSGGQITFNYSNLL